MEAASIEQKIDQAKKTRSSVTHWGITQCPGLGSWYFSCVLLVYPVYLVAFLIFLNSTKLLYVFLLALFMIGCCSFAETLHLG